MGEKFAPHLRGDGPSGHAAGGGSIYVGLRDLVRDGLIEQAIDEGSILIGRGFHVAALYLAELLYQPADCRGHNEAPAPRADERQYVRHLLIATKWRGTLESLRASMLLARYYEHVGDTENQSKHLEPIFKSRFRFHDLVSPREYLAQRDAALEVSAGQEWLRSALASLELLEPADAASQASHLAHLAMLRRELGF